MSIGTEGGEGAPLAVYVLRPTAASRRVIDSGSAIVARPPTEADHVLAYYESNRYGAENMRTYEEKLYHAAGRLMADYPTVAKAAIPVTDLIQVGTYDYEARRLTITDQAALDAWQEEDS